MDTYSVNVTGIDEEVKLPIIRRDEPLPLFSIVISHYASAWIVDLGSGSVSVDSQRVKSVRLNLLIPVVLVRFSRDIRHCVENVAWNRVQSSRVDKIYLEKNKELKSSISDASVAGYL